MPLLALLQSMGISLGTPARRRIFSERWGESRGADADGVVRSVYIAADAMLTAVPVELRGSVLNVGGAKPLFGRPSTSAE